MATARRVYVYLLSGVSLGVLLVGLSLLLDVLLSALGLGSGQYLYGSDQGRREQLTLGAALVAVGLPVWLIHWTLAERSVRSGRDGAEVERSGAMRGLYVAAVLAILLAFAASQATGLIRNLVYALGGGPPNAYGDPAGMLAALAVTVAAWVYHQAVRLDDWRRGPIHGAGAWLPRLYVYGAAGVSLLVLLLALIDLAGLALRAVFAVEQPVYADPVAWWLSPLTSSVAAVAVAGVIWIGHWWYAGRLVTESSDRVEAERPARLRLAYFGGIGVVLAGAVVIELIRALQPLAERALGIATPTGSDRLAVIVLGPLLGAVLFAVAWWLHRAWFAADTGAVARSDPGRLATADRLDMYGHALLGLAFTGVSAAWLIGVVIEATLGSASLLSGDDVLRRQMAIAAPALVLGAIVWLWAWSRAQRRRIADPSAEAASAIRRAALLAVLGSSVVGAIGGFGFLFYRLFGSLFGVSLSQDVATELSRPLGVIAVALVAGVTHGLAIRRDQSIRATAVGRTEPPSAVEPISAPQAATGVAVDLRLSGPDEGPIITALDALRELPPGYELQIREPPRPSD